MVEVGGRPLLWHIMKIFSGQGINEFVVCLGYKGYVIKEYFSNYFLHMSDVTFDIAANAMTVHQRHAEPWKVTLVDTGEATMTGGRIKRVRDYVKDEAEFCLTYGDGVGDVDIRGSVDFHRQHGKLATMTAVQPPGRYGALQLEGDRIRSFVEKPQGDGGWVNAGFFVLSPKALDYIEGDEIIWEREPLEGLAAADELRAWHHNGFWRPMDTLRDKQLLEELWTSGKAPWKSW